MIDDTPTAPAVFRCARVERKRGVGIALHAHAESQLIYAVSGTMQVHTTMGRWLVPPALAVWIPSSVQHRVEVISDAELWLIHWSPEATAAWAPSGLIERAFALRMTSLLRELLDLASTSEAGSMRAELAVRLILQELTAVFDAPTYLPLPSSGIGRRIADRVLADPGDRRSLHDLAGDAATSARTISRLFPVETGQTFKAWRQRVRIALAIERLACGTSIQHVARETGFASAAAFAFAFRQVTMMSPSDFQRSNVDPGRSPRQIESG